MISSNNVFFIRTRRAALSANAQTDAENTAASAAVAAKASDTSLAAATVTASTDAALKRVFKTCFVYIF